MQSVLWQNQERLTDKEIEAYKKYIQEKHPDIKITKVDVTVSLPRTALLRL